MCLHVYAWECCECVCILLLCACMSVFLCVFLCLWACISVCMCAYVCMQHLQEAGTRVGVLGLVPRVGTSMLFLEVTFFCFKDVLGLSDRPWNITTVSLNTIPLTQFLLTVHINTPPSDTLPISILIPRFLKKNLCYHWTYNLQMPQSKFPGYKAFLDLPDFGHHHCSLILILNLMVNECI